MFEKKNRNATFFSEILYQHQEANWQTLQQTAFVVHQLNF